MMYKLLLVSLLVIGSINLQAQRAVLVDSVMFDTSRSVDYLLSMDGTGKGPHALISYVTGKDNPHEVIYKGKSILKLPPISSLNYINDTMMLVGKYEKRDGEMYVWLVRYQIKPAGGIFLQDSIPIVLPEIVNSLEGFLPRRPLFVTTDDAVEGGGGISVFRIYDENLKVVKTIQPFPEGSGLGGRIYVQEDELTFVSIDAYDKSHVFYGSVDYRTMETTSMNYIRIDPGFDITSYFFIEKKLYITGYNKLSGTPPKYFSLMVFDQKGNLERTLKLPSPIWKMTSDTNKNVYWMDMKHKLYLNGSLMSDLIGEAFHGNYISTYAKPHSKIYFYEIK